MIDLSAPFRLATPADAPALAELVNFAGEGLPLHVWTGMAAPGQDPWDFGRDRQAKKAAEGPIVVADLGDGAIAGLTGYPIGSEPEPVTPDIPPLFVPLLELENAAPDSWYVNVLAGYPAHRGQGWGGKLLDIAEDIARAEGKLRMSLIVAGHNGGARALYARKGYVETESRDCDPGDWETETDTWVLMIKPL